MDLRSRRSRASRFGPWALAAVVCFALPTAARSADPAYFTDQFDLFFPDDSAQEHAPAHEDNLRDWAEPHVPSSPVAEPMAEPIAAPVVSPALPVESAPADPVTAAPKPVTNPSPAMEPAAPPPPRAETAKSVVESPAPPAPEPAPARAKKPRKAARKVLTVESERDVAPAAKPAAAKVAARTAPAPVAVATPAPIEKPEPAAKPAPEPTAVAEASPPAVSAPAAPLPEAMPMAPPAPPTESPVAATVEPPVPVAARPTGLAGLRAQLGSMGGGLWLVIAMAVLGVAAMIAQAAAGARGRRRLEANFEDARAYLEGQVEQKLQAQAEAYESKIALLREQVASARKHADEVRRVAEAAIALRAEPAAHCGANGEDAGARSMRDFLHGVAHELDGIVESINIAEAARGIFSDEAWDYGEDFPLPSIELHEATLAGTQYEDLLVVIQNAYAALAPINEQMRAGYKIAPMSVQDALSQLEAARDAVRAVLRAESAESVDWEQAA